MSAGRTIFTCEEHSVDDILPIRVIVIGAGPWGLISAIRLRQRVPNLSLQVYDKNTDVGGTWHENRYPGVGCDIPVMSYQLTFEPNREWTSFYASGAEIGEYWKHVARKYHLYQHIKLSHRVCGVHWDS